MTAYEARVVAGSIFPATCLECGTVLLEGDKCDHFDGSDGSLSMNMEDGDA